MFKKDCLLIDLVTNTLGGVLSTALKQELDTLLIFMSRTLTLSELILGFVVLLTKRG